MAEAVEFIIRSSEVIGVTSAKHTLTKSISMMFLTGSDTFGVDV